MSFYPGPELAQLRQAELLAEAANEHLARLAREGQLPSNAHRAPARRIVAIATAVAILLLIIATSMNGSDVIQTALQCCRA
jgi:hypothetical protein